MYYVENYELDIIPGVDTKFEVELSTNYKRVVGFTFTAAEATTHSDMLISYIGTNKLYFDNNLLADENTPLRLFHAQEVCFECKFAPYKFEITKKVKVIGSLSTFALLAGVIYLSVLYENDIAGNTLTESEKC